MPTSRAETGWLVRSGTRIHSSLWPDGTGTAASCSDRSAQADTAVQSRELPRPRPRGRVLRLCSVREEHPAVAHDVRKRFTLLSLGSPRNTNRAAEDQKKLRQKGKITSPDSFYNTCPNLIIIQISTCQRNDSCYWPRDIKKSPFKLTSLQ